MMHNFRLTSFDGTDTQTRTSDFIYDYVIKDDFIYMLKTDRSVCRTRNLSGIQCIDTAPAEARSIEVMDDIIYVGTNTGAIYSSDAIKRIKKIVPAALFPILFDE